MKRLLVYIVFLATSVWHANAVAFREIYVSGDSWETVTLAGDVNFRAGLDASVAVYCDSDCDYIKFDCMFVLNPDNPCGANVLKISAEDQSFTDAMLLGFTSTFTWYDKYLYFGLETSECSTGGSFRCTATCTDDSNSGSSSSDALETAKSSSSSTGATSSMPDVTSLLTGMMG